jgi:hypothetical protein
MRKRRSTALLGAAGICAVGRFYTDTSGNQQLPVADEVDGAWGNAATVKYGHEQAGHLPITVKPRTGGIPGPRC